MAGATPTPEQLLYEVEDLLRTAPPWPTIQDATEENLDWLGRAAAVIQRWDGVKGAFFTLALSKLQDLVYGLGHQGFVDIMVLLNQAKHDLRMRTSGPATIAVPQGNVFEYFDEIRKVLEQATQEVLFVDPYLDADFVSRYLSSIRTGVTIRLLTTEKKLSVLLPAVDLFIKQNTSTVEIRTSIGLHDRFVFVDKASGYQSGASFKDGARFAHVTITQITDAFAAILLAYETLWSAGKVER